MLPFFWKRGKYSTNRRGVEVRIIWNPWPPAGRAGQPFFWYNTRNMNYAFQTFGCRLNRAEALDQEAAAIAAGHAVVPVGPDANIIVVRACSVTERAQHDCEKAIAALKVQYPWAQVVVTGCYPGARSRTLPGVLAHPAPDGAVPMRTARAYLKAQDGCGGKCAFCTVPHYRGAPRSEPLDGVLARARAFISAGYREIVLTGCNLSLYHDSGADLGALLGAIAELPSPGHRVRLGSLEPGLCDGSVLDAFASHPNICKFLHLCVQSGSDKVLAAMHRPYTADGIADVVRRAKLAVPGIAIGADMITGFPGETEEDFAMSKDLVSRLGVVNAHVFPFSERPGTEAATMPDQVDKETRRERARALNDLAVRNRAEFAALFRDQTVEVCIEADLTAPRHHHHHHHHRNHAGPGVSDRGRIVPSSQVDDGALCAGWTSEYLPCRITDRFAPRRQLVKVRVGEVDGDILRGVIVDR